MRAFLREPLVHFVLGGAALFGLHAVFADGHDPAGDRIVVSPAREASLAARFESAWMRKPTRSELDGLIDDFVTEEVLVREARTLGLDRDDLIVRRRLRQKLELLDEARSERSPSDAELQGFLDRHAERFALPARVSFEQRLVSPDRHGAGAAGLADTLLVRLRADPEGSAAAAGDPTLLPGSVSRATPREVAAVFGADLADALDGLPLGRWSGPVRSTFGLHLLRVTAREPARAPTLADVRDAVARDWSAEAHESARAKLYRDLRSRYRVEVASPAVGLVSEPASPLARVARGS